MLWMFQRVMFMELKNLENKKLLDLNLREKIILAPIIILIFWIGFYPSPVTRTFDATITKLITRVDPANFRPSSSKEHAGTEHKPSVAKISKHDLPKLWELE